MSLALIESYSWTSVRRKIRSESRKGRDKADYATCLAPKKVILNTKASLSAPYIA